MFTARFAVTLTVSLAFATSFVRNVQAADPDSGNIQLGTVAVTARQSTGSVAQMGPVQVISAAQLQATGLASVGEILQQLTSMGSGVNAAIDTGADGESNLNLRNLGTNRLLVLVNGRRWIPFLQGQVDLNSIPLAIVDHIDVLKAGASARYGSGAVAGVVNIVTKTDMRGASASAYFGEYVQGSERDGQTQSYQFSDGYGDQDGNLLFNAAYTSQRPILGGERDLSSVPKFGTGVTRGASVTPQGRFVVVDPNTGQKQDLTLIGGTDGSSLADYRPFDKSSDFFNYAAGNYLLTPSERSSLFVHGERNLGANLNLHFSALYNDRRSAQQSGPAEITIGAQTATPISVSASNPYNPFGFDLTATGANPTLLFLARQPVEVGPRHFREDAQTEYFNAGVNGGFSLAAHDFTWNADAIVSRTHMTTSEGLIFNLQRLATALGPITDCGPGTPNPDCVPLNLFGGQYNGGSITPAMIAYITSSAQSSLESNLRNYQVSLGTDLAQLPAGPLQATLGYQYLHEDGSDQPDALMAAGLSSESADTPISGGYSANEGSLLLHAPLTQALNLDAGFRHSHYDSFGSVNSTLLAAHWTLNDAVTLRAHWSRDFRAPSIAELFTQSVTGTASVSDPCSHYPQTGGNLAANCAADGVPGGYTQVNTDVPSSSGRNPGLQPETGHTRTLGGNFTPWHGLPLSFDLDYFKIEVNHAIGTLDPQDILNGCYLSGRGDLCALVTRNASGAISNLQNGNANLGALLTEGMDAAVHYSLNTTAYGRFDFGWQATWVKRFTHSQPNLTDPSAPLVSELAGTETGRPLGAYPKFKSELDAAWQYRNWTLGWRVHYVSDLNEACSDKYDGSALSFTNLGLCTYPDFQNNALSRNKLGASTWHDLRADYRLGNGNTMLSIGVLNLFDKQPPIGHSMSNSFDATVYPIPGRFPYVSITHSF